jgi:hypothetical protein
MRPRLRHGWKPPNPRISTLPPPKAVIGLQADLTSTLQAVQVTQHVLEMFRRTLPDSSDSLPVLDRLANRLTKIAAELRKLGPP